MAKSLLLSILSDTLGKYVEGLTKENLKLGVWSGKIELTNLNLKSSSLEELHLPIKVDKGSLETLSLKIPWAHLESKPVVVRLDGIYLQASSLSFEKKSPSEIKEYILDTRRKVLERIEDSIKNALEKPLEIEDATKKATYIQQLTTKIIDNLEIKITNFHLRFEDQCAKDLNKFSLGLTIEKIELATTDENWNIKYIDRSDEDLKQHSIHKLGNIINVGVYWNTNDSAMNTDKIDHWKTLMKGIIYSFNSDQELDSPTADGNYILKPPNLFSLKLTNSEKCNQDKPNTDVFIETSKLLFCLTHKQVSQMYILLNNFSQLERKKQIALFRPQLRPTQDPRSWWKFAYKLISGKGFHSLNDVESVILCIQSRKKYTLFYKNLMIQRELSKLKDPQYKQTQIEIPEEIQDIELSLPMPALIEFRQIAIKEAMVEIASLKKEQEKSKKIISEGNKKNLSQNSVSKAQATKKTGFFSRFWYSNSDKISDPEHSTKADSSLLLSPDNEAEEDEKLMESIESQFLKLSEESMEASEQEFSMRINFSMAMDLSVYDSSQLVAQLQTSWHSLFEIRYSDMIFNLSLDKFLVKDRITINPLHQEILSVVPLENLVSQSQAHTNLLSKIGSDISPFKISIKQSHNKTDISGFALPIRFVWNEECLHSLICIFSNQSNQFFESNRLLINTQRKIEDMSAKPMPPVTLKFELFVPNIVFPVDCLVDNGGILFDAGFITLDGISENGKFDGKVQINSMNINIADKFNYLNSIAGSIVEKTTNDYLVNPFDITINFNLQKHHDSMNFIAIESSKSIQLDLDAQKLMKLKFIIEKALVSLDTSEELISVIESNPSGYIIEERSTYVEPLFKAMKVDALFFSFCIKLNIEDTHFCELSYESISASVVNRANDLSLEIDVQNIQLMDSIRPERFSRIYWMGNSENKEEKIKIIVHNIKNKLSPLYNGYKTESSLHFPSVNLTIDDWTTQTYSKLLEDLVSSYLLYEDQKKNCSIFAKKIDQIHPDLDHKHPDLSKTDFFVGGIHFVFDIESISLDILSNTFRKRDELQISTDIISQHSFERGFSSQLNRLHCSADLKELKQVSLSVESFDIIDQRPESQSNAYKYIFSNVPQKLPPNFIKSESEDRRSYPSLLVVKFEEIDSHYTNVNIWLKDITTYVSMDIIVDFADMNLKNINAFNQLFNQFLNNKKIKSLADSNQEKIKEIIYNKISQQGFDRKVFLINGKILKPRLLFLVDPTKPDSNAIEWKCEVDILFKKETSQDLSDRYTQSFNFYINDTQILVIPDLSQLIPSHSLIEPFALSLSMKQEFEKSKNLTNNAIFASGPLFFKVSLNDIVLMQSILNRISLSTKVEDLTQSQNEFSQELNRKKQQKFEEQAENVLPAKSQNSSINIVRCDVAEIRLLLINDYNGLNIPMLRSSFIGASFSVDGFPMQFSGEGSLSFRSDYYNVALSLWEPFIEPWTSNLALHYDLNGLNIQIESNQIFQCNISGEFLKCLVSAHSLLEKIGKMGRSGSLRTNYQYSIQNHLGVPVDLIDPVKNALLVKLEDNKMDFLQDMNSRNRIETDGYSINRLNLLISGELGDQCSPLLNLPLNIQKPRIFKIISKNSSQSKSVFSEPIIVEVYEYSRYYPLKRSWGEPWTKMNDPNKWSDSKMHGKKDPKEVKLPENWYWIESDWRVDMNGKIGVDFDKDGWDYAPSFSSFIGSRKSRDMLATDVVRRRRWIRTRKFKTPQTFENLISKNLVWDIKINPDESKKIIISSDIQIRNSLSFPIEYTFVDFSSENFASENKEIPHLKKFTVQANDISYVPIIYSQYNFLIVRPSDSNFLWSNAISIRIKSNQRSAKASQLSDITCPNQTASMNLYFKVSVDDIDEIIYVNCSSSMIFRNLTPTLLNIFLEGSNQMNESKLLSQGEEFKPTQLDSKNSIMMKLKISQYSSKNPLLLNFTQNDTTKEQFITLNADGNENPDSLALSFKIIKNSFQIYEMIIYSKFLFIDKAGLNMTIRSKFNDGSIINRNSFSTNQVPSIEQSNHISEMWVQGANGLTMFEPSENNVISLGLNNGSSWIHDISLDSFGSMKSNFTFDDQPTSISYNLALQTSSLSPMYDFIKVLSVVPSYCIINFLDEPLELRPIDLKEGISDFIVPPKSKLNWHNSIFSNSTSVRIRSSDTFWSLGTIDLNEIGSTDLILPLISESKDGNDMVIIHAEIRFSEPFEDSYVTITIWKSIFGQKLKLKNKFIRLNPYLSIKNESYLPFVFRQSNLLSLIQNSTNSSDFIDKSSKFQLIVPPRSHLPYGWADQNDSHSLSGSIGSEFDDNNIFTIDMMRVNEPISLSAQSPQDYHENLFYEVKTGGEGKTIYIFYQDKKTRGVKSFSDEELIELRQKDLVVDFLIPTLSISIIPESPFRREELCAYVDNLQVQFVSARNQSLFDVLTSVEISARDIQIDNFSESHIYPVLLNTFNGKEKRLAAKKRRQKSSSGDDSSDTASISSKSQYEYEDEPFFLFTVVKEYSLLSDSAMFKYVALRILEATIAIDSSSLLLFAGDFLYDILKYVSNFDFMEYDEMSLFNDSSHTPELYDSSKELITNQDSQSNNPFSLFIQKYNQKVHDDLLRKNFDIVKSIETSKDSKVFLKNLTIHPVCVKLTFIPSTFPRDMSQITQLGQLGQIRNLQKMAAIQDFELKINSFLVENAFESTRSLKLRVISKIIRDFQSNLVQIAGNLFGSMSLLGKPAGLYKNIGNGVQDFFYEPYLGMMQGPQDFVRGLGKGTSRLITGVATGVLGSTASIIGSATSGVSSVAKGVVKLSGDDEYMKKREEKRRSSKAQHGILSGMKAGGESIVSGFASGLTGLVTKPYEETRKSGAVGFFKGVGQGIVGVAVKPVLGVTDGITSITNSFNNQVSDSSLFKSIRPSRMFERSLNDTFDPVLIPMDFFAANAKQFVLSLAASKNEKVEVYSCIPLGYSSNEVKNPDLVPYAVFITDKYLYLLSSSTKKIFLMEFGEISHFSYSKDMSDGSGKQFILVKSFNGDNDKAIPCKSSQFAQDLYAKLYFHSYKMGNPRQVMPIETTFPPNLEHLPSRVSPDLPMESSNALPLSESNKNLSQTEEEQAQETYQFGQANSLKFPSQKLSHEKLIESYRKKYSAISFVKNDISNSVDRNEYFKQIDQISSNLISDWANNNSNLFNPSKCIVCILLNNTSSHIQLRDIEIKEGKNFSVLGVGDGFDRDSRIIHENGGAVVLFVYGYMPTLLDLAHLKLKVYTSACDILLATRKNRNEFSNIRGYNVGYFEKTQTDNWAKFVISIS